MTLTSIGDWKDIAGYDQYQTEISILDSDTVDRHFIVKMSGSAKSTLAAKGYDDKLFFNNEGVLSAITKMLRPERINDKPVLGITEENLLKLIEILEKVR